MIVVACCTKPMGRLACLSGWFQDVGKRSRINLFEFVMCLQLAMFSG